MYALIPGLGEGDLFFGEVASSTGFYGLEGGDAESCSANVVLVLEEGGRRFGGRVRAWAIFHECPCVYL